MILILSRTSLRLRKFLFKSIFLEGLEFLGVEIDREANNVRGKVREISKAGCKVKAFVIPTNEELVIARDTLELIKK